MESEFGIINGALAGEALTTRALRSTKELLDCLRS